MFWRKGKQLIERPVGASMITGAALMTRPELTPRQREMAARHNFLRVADEYIDLLQELVDAHELLDQVYADYVEARNAAEAALEPAERVPAEPATMHG